MMLNSVQILRAFAALFVTIYHLRAIETLSISSSGTILEQTGLVEPGLVSGLWANGFVGVDLFFVISGFIMVFVTKTYTPGIKQVSTFMFGRISRIYPLWWLFASAMVIYFLFAYGSPVDAGRAAASGQTSTEHLLKSYFLIPQSTWPVLGVGWTLIHEMYFYFVFALTLLLPRRWLPLILAIWAGVIVMGYFGGLSSTFANDYLALVFYPMTIEFVLGAAVGLLILSGHIWRPGLILMIAAVWLVGMMQFIPSPENSGNWGRFILQWGRVLFFGLPCATLVYGLVSLEINNRLHMFLPACAASLGFILGVLVVGERVALEGAVLVGIIGAILSGWLIYTIRQFMEPVSQLIETGLVAIGNWSYSLYLCHMLVLSAVRRIFPWLADYGENRLGLSGESMDLFRLGNAGIWDNVIFLIVSFGVTILVSWLTYRYFEQPLTRSLARVRHQIFAT